MDNDYERVILVKPEVFMYKIPPRVSNRAYRAAEWNLENPDWSGRMRILSKGPKCIIKLEDKNSGELFAACPIDTYPSSSVESVSDSARYFVLCIRDESGRSAFIGIGFVDRSDSFDFNVALQDHFKYLKKDEELAKAPVLQDEKKLDLSFKEGQTIKINIGKKTESSTGGISRPKPQSNNSGPILLPPPPGSKNPNLAANKPNWSNQAAAAPSASKPQTSQTSVNSNQANDFLLDFGSLQSSAQSRPPEAPKSSGASANLLDLDF